jgi:hypothetical protein
VRVTANLNIYHLSHIYSINSKIDNVQLSFARYISKLGPILRVAHDRLISFNCRKKIENMITDVTDGRNWSLLANLAIMSVVKKHVFNIIFSILDFQTISLILYV